MSVDLVKHVQSNGPKWARKLQPTRQGELDTSCSVYAAINLVKLSVALAGIDETLDYDELFDECIESLESKKLTARLISGPGLGTKHWWAIVEAAAEEASDQLGVDVLPRWENDKVSQKQVEAKIKSGSPVGLLTKPSDRTHYTVIKGYNAESFTLFDSVGYRKLDRQLKSGNENFFKSKTIVTLDVK